MERIRSSLRAGGVTAALFLVGALVVLPPFALLPGPLALAAVPVGAGWLILVVRSARSGLYVAPEGLTIRKVWSTHFVPQHDVAALDWTLSLFPYLEPCVVVRLTSGRRFTVPSVAAADKWFGSGSTTEEGLANLDARMQKVFSTTGAQPPL